MQLFAHGTLLSCVLMMLLTSCTADVYVVKRYDPLVKTRSGKIRGFREEKFGRHVNAFLGVPFAQPPLGPLRFRKPLPVKPWMRELKAMFFPPSCVQPDVVVNRVFNFTQDERSEDCLYLNIWAPLTNNTGDSRPKTVMVFLYGGAFFFGSTNYRFYNGAILAALTDVIIVTVNYRLGPFGFMNARIPEIPGNQGLWDQHLAFRWIKENIQHFNGDPESITIFGHSAGGISLGFHLVSPLSKGLFKRAIIQSGAPYYKITDNPNEARQQFEAAAGALGCATSEDFASGKDMKMVVECMLSKNTSEILTSLEYFNDRVKTTYVPWPGDDLVPQDLPDAIREGNVNDMDLLVGATMDEGSLFIQYYLSSVLDFANPETITKRGLKVYLSFLFRLIRQRLPQEIAEQYVSADPNESNAEFLRRAGHSLGDFGFVCPLVRFAADFASRNNNVYFYEFGYRPGYSWNEQWQGVAHFDEIPFIFGTNLNTPEFNVTREERIFTLFMMHTWSYFAKTGHLPNIFGKKWPQFNGATRPYVHLNGRHTAIREGIGNRCEFWKFRNYKFVTPPRPDLDELWMRPTPSYDGLASL
ncbi:acetylcholinesterase-1-like [Varroa destructor]|uniref:acetylcholinesterase n=1 Tax=Varroa destructor TaxID=109461 RepID=A0A7M7K227_VARDE|nr:acetylcholinesterase-1-like [Varroa destructor]XP_022654431.1 acetylcholinesterase-1-like [Varroa destructor]XP_022654432.1 acetylcholinesterase-1-like [Varroa destructor]